MGAVAIDLLQDSPEEGFQFFIRIGSYGCPAPCARPSRVFTLANAANSETVTSQKVAMPFRRRQPKMDLVLQLL